MVSTFYTPPQISNEEAFPLKNIVGDLLKQYQQQQENQARGTALKYQEPNLIEALTKSKLENKYYGPNMESQIGLRGAQTGHLNAQASKTPFEIELLKAQTGGAGALADKRRATMQLLSQMLQGNGLGLQTNEGNMNASQGSLPFSGQGMMANPNAMNQGQNQNPNQMQPSSAQLSFPQAAFAMHELGLGQPKFIEANGQHIAITPFGNIPVAQGLTEQQKALSKEDAKKISKLEDSALGAYQKQETFDQLNNILGSPVFEQMRQHPLLGGYELKYWEKQGNPEQQSMIGEAKTYMGNIIKDSSRDFAGQFRVGEQALLNNMKPNETDSLNTMKGKSEALTYLNAILAKRSELEADLMRNKNLSALAAKREVDKLINPKEIKSQIQMKLYPKEAAIAARKELLKRQLGQ